MNYSLFHFIVALASVCILYPTTFLLNAQVFNSGWPIFIYLGLTAIWWLINLLSRSVKLNIVSEQICKILAVCTIFISVSYIAEQGESFMTIDSFGQGLLLWFVTMIVLAVCFSLIGGGILSLFRAQNWLWPANIVNNIAYAIAAVFIAIGTFAFTMDVCPVAAFFSLLSFVGFSNSNNYAKDDGTETMTDENGQTFSVRKFGNDYIDSDGHVYRERPDNKTLRRIR